MYLPGMVVHHQVSRDRLTRAYFHRWFYWHGISRAVCAELTTCICSSRSTAQPRQGSASWHASRCRSGVTLAARPSALDGGGVRPATITHSEYQLRCGVLGGQRFCERWRDEKRPEGLVAPTDAVPRPNHVTRSQAS